MLIVYVRKAVGKKETPKKGFPKRSDVQRRKWDQKEEGEDPAGEKMSDVGIMENRKINAEGQAVARAGSASSQWEGKLRPGECSAGGQWVLAWGNQVSSNFKSSVMTCY